MNITQLHALREMENKRLDAALARDDESGAMEIAREIGKISKCIANRNRQGAALVKTP